MPRYFSMKYSADQVLRSNSFPLDLSHAYRTQLEASEALRTMRVEVPAMQGQTYGLFQTVKMPEVAIIAEANFPDRYDTTAADLVESARVQIAKDVIHPMRTYDIQGADITQVQLDLTRRQEGLERFTQALANTPVSLRLGLKLQSPGYDTTSSMDSMCMHEMYAADGFVHNESHDLDLAVVAAALRDISKHASVDAARHVDVLIDTFRHELKQTQDRTPAAYSHALEKALRTYAEECIPNDATAVMLRIPNSRTYVEQAIAQMKSQGERDYETAFAERLPVAMRSRFHQLYEHNLGYLQAESPDAPENHALAVGAALHVLRTDIDDRATRQYLDRMIQEANQDSVPLRKPDTELTTGTVKYITQYIDYGAFLYGSKTPTPDGKMYDSIAEARANARTHMTSFDHDGITTMLVVDATQEVYRDNRFHLPELNPKAITGVICSITDMSTQSTHVLTMPVQEGRIDWNALRDAINEYTGPRQYGHFHQFANGVEVTLVEAPANLQDCMMQHLQGQLGITSQEAQEKFVEAFRFKLAYSGAESLYGRIMDAAYYATDHIENEAEREGIIAMAQKAMEADIAKQNLTTQTTWQLSELPDFMLLGMRENIIGERALFMQDGYTPEQANALALLKVVNTRCTEMHFSARLDSEMLEYLAPLTALKERAAQIAIDAGCPKESMLAVTRVSIDKDRAHAGALTSNTVSDVFEMVLQKMNPIQYLATRNAISHLSKEMFREMEEPSADNQQEDLQARILKYAGKLQEKLKSDGIEYPVIPDAKDVLEAMPSYLAQREVQWPTFAAQYTSALPCHLQEAFIDHYHAALVEINIYSDAETQANMSFAACCALKNMVKDETLAPGDQLIVAGLVDTAITQALQLGVQYEAIEELMHDGNEEISND